MTSSNLKSAKINLWKESFDSTISMFFGVSLDILHVAILVRYLTQEEVSIFFFSYAFVYLFIQVPKGYSIAVRKKATEYNKGREKYLWGGLITIIPSMMSIFVLFWFIIKPLINMYSSLYLSTTVTIAIFLASLGYGILELAKYYMAGCNNPGFAEKFRAFVSKIAMILLTIILLSKYPTVESTLIAVALTYGLSGIYLLKLTPHEYKLPSKKTVYEILKFSKWSLPTSLLNDFYNRWDTLVLGFMVGSLSVGYYDSSIRNGFLATVLAVGSSRSSTVKISGLYESGEDIMNISRKLIILSTFLIMPALIVILFNGTYLLNIVFGEEYIAAKWYLVGITIQYIFQCYRFQFESIFNGIDKPKYTTKTSAISVFVNIITAPFFVIYFGGLGVIYSTILAEIFRVIIYQYQIKNIFEQTIYSKSISIQYAVFVILTITIYVISTIFKFNNFIFLIISCIISFIGFYSLQYMLSREIKELMIEFKNDVLN